MLRLAAVVVLAVAVAAQPPKADEIRALVEKLGSGEFTEREDATKRLEALGPAALDELRPACKSENAETARRAQDLVRKIERKLANEKTLAPTLVSLDATDVPLDAVLDELSKQAKCEVVLGGVKPEELAGKKVAVSTGGKVPFWAAVLKVCDAADLQIASAGGFLAPGATPYLGRPATVKGAVRVAVNPQQAVVLEPRTAGRRPAAVYRAVLVEAVPVPKAAASGSPAVLLQAWPEPRLRWETTNGVKVAKATDPTGARLVAQTSATEQTPFKVAEGGVVIIRNPDGTARVVRDRPDPDLGFVPNVRQWLVKFRPSDRPIEVMKELDVSIFATLRTGFEPLCQASDLTPNKAITGVGVPGVELSVNYGRNPAGLLVASVELSYDPKIVQPTGAGDELSGVRGGGAGPGNNTVYGVRITDADGKPFVLGLASGRHGFEPASQRVVVRATLELHPDKGGHGPPAVVAFWGTHAKPVEVPVTLKDVPLGGGK